MSEEKIVVPRRPVGSSMVRVRSVRVPDGVWEAAQERGREVDLPVSELVRLLLTAFVSGEIGVPVVSVSFPLPGETASAVLTD